MVASNSALSISTFMVIGPTCFFLGILFSLFPYDFPLLWSSNPLSESHLDQVETHLKLLFNSPNLITRIFHIVTGMGLMGLIMKLYKPSESNMLFDGGSLVLYMIAVIIYLTNIVKGLRIVNVGAYGLVNLHELNQDQLDDVDSSGNNAESGKSVLGREDNLKVLAASNTITALVLVGVIVLQIGQWYADRVDQRERKKAEDEYKKQKKDAAESKTTGATSPAAEAEATTTATATPGTKRGGSKKNK